jgi:aminoglycoside phosphotransferase (APT) family kinase protein
MEDRIVKWLSSVEPDSTLLRTWELGGGISSAMTAFTISSNGESRNLILRQPNDWTLANVPYVVRKEFDRLGALHRGGLPVQAPFFCDETDSHFGRPGLVIEYIDGSPDLNPLDLSNYLNQLARQLANIHHFDPNTPGLALPEAAVHEFERFRDGRVPPADPAFQVDRIWATLSDLASPQTRNEPVLLHGDFWPGNILWRDGSLVAVIDWEETRAGDPLLDLSISRLDLWWVFGRRAMETFTECYLAVNPLNPIDESLLPLWDLWAATETRVEPREMGPLVRFAGTA